MNDGPIPGPGPGPDPRPIPGPGTFHVVALGCPKARVDSEFVLGALLAAGWEGVEDPAEADLIVVNTCAFIEPATEESIETVLELARYREEGRCRHLVVTGCLPQRYGQDLVSALPEVDIFLGTGSYHRLARWLREGEDPVSLPGDRPGFLNREPDIRVGSWAPHSAWLKLGEGCDRRCTFCIIPRLRGPARSVPAEILSAEARNLVEAGVRELNLVAQDTTSWGRDLAGSPRLEALVASLAAIPRLRRIRLQYLHPEGVRGELLDAMRELDPVCRYLDIPVQHAASGVLRRMGRAWGRPELEALLQRARACVPGLAVRTTVIVGFPGETEADFRELVEFVQAQRFERLGVFRYHPEEGTAAARLPDPVPEPAIQERFDELVNTQAHIARDLNRVHVGQVLPVMVDGPSAESEWLLEGRLESQAPEVDGRVYIASAPGGVTSGMLGEVRITQASEVDLAGTWCKASEDRSHTGNSRGPPEIAIEE